MKHDLNTAKKKCEFFIKILGRLQNDLEKTMIDHSTKHLEFSNHIYNETYQEVFDKGGELEQYMTNFELVSELLKSELSVIASSRTDFQEQLDGYIRSN